MTASLFSIIVPVYNVEKYVGECVDSILSQIYKDFELILVNDGSTDRSGYICDSYAYHANVRVIHKPNGGLSSARNAGLDVAIGEYILFVDSDDYLSDDSVLATLANKIRDSRTDVVLVGCRNINCKGNLVCVSRHNYAIDGVQSDDINTLTKLLYRNGHFPGAAWIMCVKRSLIAKEQFRFPLGVNAEDIIWINKVLTACTSLDAIDIPLYTYRTERQGQITGKASVKSCQGIIIAVEDWLNGGKMPMFPAVSCQMAHVYMVLLMNYSQLSEVERKLIKNDVDRIAVILRHGTSAHRIIGYAVSLLGTKICGWIIWNANKLKNRLK